MVVDVGVTAYVNDYGSEHETYDFYLGYKLFDFSTTTKSKDNTVLHLLIPGEISSENYEEVSIRGWGADDSIILWTMGEDLQKAPTELEYEVLSMKETDFWMTSE